MPGLHFCNLCDSGHKLSFPSKILLYKHLKLRHPREAELEIDRNVDKRKALYKAQSTLKYSTCQLCNRNKDISDKSSPERFKSLNALSTHLYESHDKDEADAEFSRLTGKTFRCEICGRFIQSEKLLRMHKRKMHAGQGINVKPQDCHIICREEGCTWNGSGKTVFDLRAHLSEVHNHQFEIIQNKKFPTPEAFEHWCYWIENREDQPGRLIRHRGNKKLKGGYLIRMVKQCNRSGAAREKSETERTRSKRKRGSQKINGTCTLYIQAVHNLMDDSVLVEDACLTHYGHDFDLRHITLSNFDRAEIAAKCLMGVPLEKIQQDCKKTVPLSRATIKNVMKSKNIKYEKLQRSPRSRRKKTQTRDDPSMDPGAIRKQPFQLPESAAMEDNLAVASIEERDFGGTSFEESVDVEYEEPSFPHHQSPIRSYPVNQIMSPRRSGQIQYIEQGLGPDPALPSTSRPRLIRDNATGVVRILDPIHVSPPRPQIRYIETDVTGSRVGLPRGIRVIHHQPAMTLNADGALVDDSSHPHPHNPVIIHEGAEEVVATLVHQPQATEEESFELPYLEDPELQSKLSFLRKLTLQLTLEVEQISGGAKVSNYEAISAACELTGKAAKALSMEAVSLTSQDPAERMTIMERLLGKQNVGSKGRKGGPADHDYLKLMDGIGDELKYPSRSGY